MPEKLCRFGFLRFLGFPLPLEAFRANPGTTRPPALPRLRPRAESGIEKNPAVMLLSRKSKMHAVVVLYVVLKAVPNWLSAN